MRKIILASSSPRRKELLEKLKIPFEAIPSNFVETINPNLSPENIVTELSKGKALDVAQKNPDAVVIGADSLVFINNQIFGKPKDTEDAIRMLQTLSGKTHSVFTGMTVIMDKNIISCVTRTKVTIKTLSTDEIQNYINTQEPMDKAGAYALQERGAAFIEKVTGDFYGAVGLSLFKLNMLLSQIA